VREGCGTTLTRLLAIAGAGFVLATGHAFVRTAWFDRPPIMLTRAVAVQPAGPDATPTPPVEAETPDESPVSPLDAPVKPGSITLGEAFRLFENGAFFLDARYEADYREGHIEGAFWMPASRVATPEGMGELQIIEPGGTVVIYCTGGDCDASENTAIRLEQAGFTFDIRILGKGYVDWVEAGLPTAAGMDGTDTGEGGTP
jgi:rhodanese-related sulfurtransferase